MKIINIVSQYIRILNMRIFKTEMCSFIYLILGWGSLHLVSLIFLLTVVYRFSTGFSLGKTLLLLYLVPEWLDIRKAALVAHFLDMAVRGGSCQINSLFHRCD